MKRKFFMFYCFMFLALVFAVGGGYLLINNFVGSEIEKDIDDTTDAGNSKKIHNYYVKTWLSDNNTFGYLYSSSSTRWSGASAKANIQGFINIYLSSHTAKGGDSDKITENKTNQNFGPLWNGTSTGQYTVQSYQSVGIGTPYTSLESGVTLSVTLNHDCFDLYYYVGSNSSPSTGYFSPREMTNSYDEYDDWQSCYTNINATKVSANTQSNETVDTYIHVWVRPKQATIRFNLNGGNINGNTNNQEISSYYGALYSFPTNPTKTGYTFDGWQTYTGKEITSSDWIDVCGTYNLYAQWTPNNYKLDLNILQDGNAVYPDDFKVNFKVGSTTHTNINDFYQDVPYGTTYQITGVECDQAKYNYTYDSSEFTVTGYSIINVTISLKEYWTNINMIHPNGSEDPSVGTMTVSYNGEEHTGLRDQLDISYAYDSVIIVKNIQPATGYHLEYIGVGSNHSTSGSYTHKVTGSQTIEVKMAWNTYSVVFNANGGSGSMSNQGFTYGSAQNLRANGFTRTGYSFLGWSTSSSGGVVYTNGQSVSNLTSTHGGTVTLYAVWRDSQNPTISRCTWVQDYNSGYYAYVYAEDNVGINRVQFPTWTENNGQDDIQQNWQTSSSASGTYGNYSVNGQTYNYRYYVRVPDHNNEYGLYHTHIYVYDNAGNSTADSVGSVQFTFTITYNDNNGSGGVGSKSVVYGNSIPTIETTPTRTGFIFSGYYYGPTPWYGSNGAIVKSGSYEIGGNATVTAQWIDTWVNHTEVPKLGSGTANSPYLIDTASKLAWISYQVNYTTNSSIFAKQVCAIDMSAYTWMPIGTNAKRFTGGYNGQGYPILNLHTYDSQIEQFVGMFGVTSEAKIKNVYLSNAKIYGYARVGGIAGETFGGTEITGCFIDNKSSIVNYLDDVGGIVGRATSTTISSCAFMGTITLNGCRGAILGHPYTAVVIKDCLASTTSEVGINCGNYTGGTPTITSCLYISNGVKKYVDGDFANWVKQENMQMPLPKGLSWLAQGGTSSKNDIISGYTKVSN